MTRAPTTIIRAAVRGLATGSLMFVAGCPQPASEDTTTDSDTVTETNTDASTSTDTVTETNPGSECDDDDDCDVDQICTNGICEPASSGGCNNHSDCQDLSLCTGDGDCVPVLESPECGGNRMGPANSLDIDDLSGMTFADVDDDGADELVIVTADELHVYDSGADVPIISPRGGGGTVRALTAGDFDLDPGTDVAVITDSDMLVHSATGMGNLGAASSFPLPLPLVRHASAGDFGEALDSVLMLGDGMGVHHWDQPFLALSDVPNLDGAALDGAGGGFLLHTGNNMLEFYAPDGSLLLDGVTPSGASDLGLGLGSLEFDGEPRFATMSPIMTGDVGSTWLSLEIREPSGGRGHQLGLAQRRLLPGDGQPRRDLRRAGDRRLRRRGSQAHRAVHGRGWTRLFSAARLLDGPGLLVRRGRSRRRRRRRARAHAQP